MARAEAVCVCGQRIAWAKNPYETNGGHWVHVHNHDPQPVPEHRSSTRTPRVRRSSAA